MAPRQGISSSLLVGWRRAFGEGCLGGTKIPDFVPTVVLPDPGSTSQPVAGGRAEIGDDRRVIVNADVHGPVLARILQVLGRR